MIDTGQYSSATERTGGNSIPFPSQEERALRNKAIETDSESDWQAWRAMRDARVSAA